MQWHVMKVAMVHSEICMLSADVVFVTCAIDVKTKPS